MIRIDVIQEFVEKVKLEFYEPKGEFRIVNESIPVQFNDDEYDRIFVQGHDGSGSLYTEEQMMINALQYLGYSSNNLPENIEKQLQGKELHNWRM